MHGDTDHPGSAPREPNLDLDAGMAAAFGRRPTPTSSVLRILQTRSRSTLGIHVPETDDAPTPPVRIHKDAKDLRQPGGRYQVLGEIARGGVGVVYRGRDVDLGRDVAMKVLHDEHGSNPDVLERFVEEAQIGGQLQHPGIVPVYELGLQHDERPYFAMKLIKGETLAAQLHRRNDPGDRRRRFLGVFEQVCQTVAYAHARRVVHRDLKPANIMIGSFGEVQVVDWGFAKVLPEDVAEDAPPAEALPVQDQPRSVIQTVRTGSERGSQSVMGSVLGTPAYMPPEQANGHVDRMDQRSDVFGLGAILCEILTGRPPYTKEHGDLVQQAALADTHHAVRLLDACGAPRDLVALCKQCLAASRSARPASAREVAEAIVAYLHSVEERARTAELRAVAAKERARSTLLLSAAAALILALGSAAWLWMESEARRRQDDAERIVAGATETMREQLAAANTAGPEAREAWDSVRTAAGQVERALVSEYVGAPLRRRIHRLLDDTARQATRAAGVATRMEQDRALLSALLAARVPCDADLKNSGNAYWQGLRDRRHAESLEAFAHYFGGEGLKTTSVEDAAARLRQSGSELRIEIAAFLDSWAMEILGKTGAAEFTGKLRTLAGALDGDDPWRSRLRELLVDCKSNRDQLVALATQADDRRLPAVSMVLLGVALSTAGAGEAAIEVLQRARAVHPTSVWICLTLAHEAFAAESLDLACENYRIAATLRPEQIELWHALGSTLEHAKRYADAERVFADLAARQPNDSHWQHHLGACANCMHRTTEARARYERALQLDPTQAHTHLNLGGTLLALGEVGAALASLRRAVRLDPHCALAHMDIAQILQLRGDLEGALQSARRALSSLESVETARSATSRPLHARASAHAHIAAALHAQGEFEEALDHVAKALAIDPQFLNGYIAQAKIWLSQGTLAARASALVAGSGPPLQLAVTGWMVWEHGERELGEACLERALQRDPDSVYTLQALAAVRAGQDRKPQAMALLRRALRIDPEDPAVHAGMALRLREMGKPEEAVRSLRLALRSDRFSPAHYANLGGLLAEVGKADEAVRVLRHALALQPNSSRPLGNLAGALRLQGKLDEAAEVARKAIALAPRAEAGKHHVTLGWILIEKGELADAVVQLRKGRDLARTLKEAHAGLGEALLRLNRHAEAEQVFRRGLEALPHAADLHCGLARVRLAQKQLARAEPSLRRALALDPRHARAPFYLGYALLELNRPAEALPLCQKAVDLMPDDPGAHENLGSALRQMDRLADAERSYRRALQLVPKRAGGHSGLAVVLGQLERHEEALSHHLIAARLDPRSAMHHRNAGFTLIKLDRYEAAQPHFRRSLALDPRQARVHSALGFCLAQRKEHAAAVPCYRKALELDPSDKLDWGGLGISLYWIGDSAGAIDALEKYVAGTPRSTDERIMLGDMYLRSGRTADAERIFRRAFDIDAQRSVGMLETLGGILLAQGETEAGEELLKRARQAGPQPGPARKHGAELLEAGRLQDAIEMLRSARQLAPEDPETQVLLTTAVGLFSGRYDAAVTQLEALRGRFPTPSVHLALARLHSARGDTRAALQSLQRVLELQPGSPEAHLLTGDVHRDAGRGDAARRAYRRALDTKRATPAQRARGLTGLATLDRLSGSLDAAHTGLRQAIAAEPGLARAHRESGLTLAAMGKQADALAALRRAVELDAGDADNQEALGDALAARVDADAAAAAYRAALAVLEEPVSGRTDTARARITARIEALRARLAR